MLEYDFLKMISSYEEIYKDFLLPVVICDASFEVHWSNLAAKSLYPHLVSSQGMRGLLDEFDFDDLLSRIQTEKSLRIDGALAFSDVRLNLVPIFYDGEVAGVIVMFIGPQAVITPPDILKSSQTPLSFEKSIRQSVEDIFKTMDEASYKADTFESGWIKSSFESIARSSYYILRVAANIGSYASFQQHPPELKLASQDVFGLIRSNESVISGLAEEMGIPVRFDMSDEESVVVIDAEKFQSAFYNILHNSFYFTKPGNEVEITGRASKDKVSITIRDKGLGIAEDVLPQIYKPYFSHGPGGKSAGIGLGLTLAKIIIEAHGGSIDISSAENEGCEVAITIPKNIFSRRISFEQSRTSHDNADRFSYVYVGLVDAAGSPYGRKNLPEYP